MRGTDDGAHYGRPFAWHRQLARKDLLAAWSRIEAPVLVVSGQYDQFEPPHAHRAAVDLLDRIRPGQARWIEIEGMNHFYDVYASALDAYAERNGHPAPQLAAVPILRWLRDTVGFPAQP
jgi:pimeloyl-ACP methyl ester carboxylesterase